MAESNNGRRVLIVDDERVVADTTAASFAKAAYMSYAVYSAEQALEVIPRWVPDLAVIDVHLPGTSGIDLAIHLKAQYPACKLCLISRFKGTDEMLELAREEGHSFNVLPKPVDPCELLQLAVDIPSIIGEA
jgi:CheY-like chemotaxis protein